MADEWSNRGALISKTLFKNLPDWSENAMSRNHLWRPTTSAEDCHAEYSECKVTKQILNNF